MRPRRVVTTHRADDDIAAAVDHYAGEGAPDAAGRFISELQAARNVIAEHPGIGSARIAVLVGIPEIRSVALRVFPYVVIYSDDADAVRVHRVLHSSRDLPTELGGRAY